jgi:hypothetical protein
MAYTSPEIDMAAPAGVLPAGSSYLDAADANTYFANTFNAAAWAAIPPADQTIALAEATKWLEALCWKGEKCDPAQPMAWPRKADAAGCCGAMVCTTLPAALVQATAELALGLHQNKTAIVGGVVGGGTTGAVKRQKLGDLEQEYFEPSSGASSGGKVGSTAPLILQRFPWLMDLLSPCLLDVASGGARVLHRSCVTSYAGGRW